ncbi:phosphate regulon sensor histidine kinase PhoR [Ramlibacter sp.]|uniref:phosphate regulon sensor histidine kinase PhoR n=1 Tax=Ramlibacter sp. TaxID=1917967 RepID=UPI003D144F5F
MLARLAAILLCLLAGGLLGAWFGGSRGITVGLVAGALGWFAVETLRAGRVLRWLRRGQPDRVPAVGGLWGEALERTRKALQARDRELAESKRRLDEFLAAMQASPNGVILLDPQGRIEWFNQTAAEQFGFDFARDKAQLIGNLVRAPTFSAYYQGRSWTQEVVIAAPGSTPTRPAKLSVHLHPYGEGRKLLLSRDITAVEQAEVMRRDFVANVSHEIRTPLTVLTGFVETLQNLSLAPEEHARYLQLMAQQAQRMQTLVSDLLTLSRLEGSPLPGAGEWTPVSALWTQCEQEARALSTILGRAQRLTIAAAPEFELAGSPNELISAMGNLLSNAVRYTPAGGRVDAAWVPHANGKLEVSVRDTGPGISPEHIPRLTERFYRVDRSRSRETGGTGLGLAIVKHVVQRHGAELKVESVVGEGSTFAIVFPASRVRAVRVTDGAEPRATESHSG